MKNYSTIILAFDPNNEVSVLTLKTKIASYNRPQWGAKSVDHAIRAIRELRELRSDLSYKFVISLDYIFVMEDRGTHSDYIESNLYVLDRDITELWGAILAQKITLWKTVYWKPYVCMKNSARRNMRLTWKNHVRKKPPKRMSFPAR